MKTILIKRMKLLNFKGFRETEINFKDAVTLITADNGCGKSTIMAAFNWLLTGKDQFESADINAIKTWDINNVHIPQIDHSVEATFLVNGNEVTLKRLLREKWVTKRGETTPVMEGHTTDYFINGVACGTEREYLEEVENIIPLNIFKLLTNPLYFSTILSWQDRREILFQIAPPTGDDEVLKSIKTIDKERVDYLLSILNGTNLERYKKDLAAKKREKKEQLSKIPAKITATERTRPEIPDGGFEAIEEQIQELERQISEVDAQIADRSKANEAVLEQQRKRQKTISDLKLALQKAEYESKSKRNEERNQILSSISEIEDKIKSEQRSIDSLQKEILDNNASIKNLNERKEFAQNRAPQLEEEMNKLREEFNAVNDSVFSHEVDGICPLLNVACNPLLLSKKDEAEKAFNANKSKKLDDIDARGLLLKADKEKYEKSLLKFDSDIQELIDKNLNLFSAQEQHKSAIEDLSKTLEHAKFKLEEFNAIIIPASDKEQELISQIREAEAIANDPIEQPDNSELINAKKELQLKLDNLKVILSTREQIKKVDQFISEYKEEQAALAQEIATLDGQEDALSEFTRAKISSIESRIAQLFKNTRFRLFKTLINGEIEPCCEPIDPVGVPVSVTNTAMKTNCGIDIINVLSKFYGYSAPIFIDNKESISNIQETDSQIILLEKVKGQKKLNVE